MEVGLWKADDVHSEANESCSLLSKWILSNGDYKFHFSTRTVRGQNILINGAIDYQMGKRKSHHFPKICGINVRQPTATKQTQEISSTAV